MPAFVQPNRKKAGFDFKPAEAFDSFKTQPDFMKDELMGLKQEKEVLESQTIVEEVGGFKDALEKKEERREEMMVKGDELKEESPAKVPKRKVVENRTLVERTDAFKEASREDEERRTEVKIAPEEFKAEETRNEKEERLPEAPVIPWRFKQQPPVVKQEQEQAAQEKPAEEIALHKHENAEDVPKAASENILVQGVGLFGERAGERKKFEVMRKENARLEESALKEHERKVAEERKRLSKPAAPVKKVVFAKDLKKDKVHAEGPGGVDGRGDDEGKGGESGDDAGKGKK